MSNPVAYPTPAAQFVLVVDDREVGTFAEVSGLSVSVDVQEIPEGGQNQYVRKVPGRLTWPNLVFRRGVTQQDTLFPWLQRSSGDRFAAADSKAGKQKNALVRSTAAIILVDTLGSELRSWNVIDAFPVRWSGPTFSLSSTEVASEELEIAHHGFTATKSQS